MKRRGRTTSICRHWRHIQGLILLGTCGALFILVHVLMKDSINGENIHSFGNDDSKNRMVQTHHIRQTVNDDEHTKDFKTNNVIITTDLPETTITPWEQSVPDEAVDNSFLNAVSGNQNYVKYLTESTTSDFTDTFFNKHQYRFTLNNKTACNGNVFLMSFIHSAPQNHAKRMNIRKTWGTVKRHLGANIVLVFLLAQVKDNSNTMQKKIEEESRTYQDLIQGNFIDSYKNLTYKHMMGIHWVNNFCNHTKFILKSDDDTLVDMFHLIRFLQTTSPDGDIQNFLYCSVYRNQSPVRNVHDKWYVGEDEYPYDKYPPYCEGFAYVMSVDVATKFYTLSRNVKFYWVDDVLVTGFLALRAGILHRRLDNDHSYVLMSDSDSKRRLSSLIFILDKYEIGDRNWDEIWASILKLHISSISNN